MVGREFDVVVVGAGTAGANAAYQFARRGRRVLLVERRPAALAGAQWHNGVLDRHFVRSTLAPPSGPERRAAGTDVHLRARDPLVGPTLRDATVTADMTLLGQRLRKLALDAGADLVDEVREFDVGLEAGTGRIRSLTIRRDDRAGPTTVRASLFVDASGRRGVIRRHAADLAPWCPTVRGDELCSASDADHTVDDPGGAEQFLERHGAQRGDTVTVLGISGGFSTCAVTISEDLARVGILVGCLANGRYGTAPQMASALRRHEPWIGQPVASGAGTIPLRRPYARITAAGVALVGDAASQVFPAHGSGIGIGLVAGTMLAEGVADIDDPGDPHHLWSRYQASFQREVGCDLLGFDMLRRVSTALGGSGVDALVRSGLIDEQRARTSLEQRWAPPPPADAARSAARFVRHPRLAALMVPALARAQILHAHGARHPDRLDLDALARWEHRTERLLGTLPR